MGKIMLLIDIIRNVDVQDDEATIYAVQPWNKLSEAIVLVEPDDGGVPLAAQKINAKYFLEIFLAHEFLEGWLNNLDYIPSIEEQCERIIHYAKTDA